MRALAAIGTLLAAALIAAGCGQFGKVAGEEDAASTSSSAASSESELEEGLVSNKEFDASAREAAGCEPIEKDMKDYGREHTTDPDEKLKYQENPPTSGKHFEVPLKWGVYSTEQKTSHWVHNLEHGHVVIAHKGLSGSERAELTKQRARAPFHVVMFPRAANPKDGVYYLAWRTRIFCEKPSAEALQLMIDDYLDRGPERVMSDDPKDPKEREA